MAPTLTSNSFLVNTTPHSRLTVRSPRFLVFAKKAGRFSAFQLGKSKDSENPSSSEEITNGDSGSSNPFGFNFGKVPDVTSLIPIVSSTGNGLSFGKSKRKDPGTVFVAGATGQAGIRIAQTLLREGFSVRAGVPDLDAALELARLASSYKILSEEESKRLNAVESTFDNAESIAKAIGNAGKVVVSIGRAENGPTSQVSTSDALQVIQAAQLAGVSHAAIIYDGDTSPTSTYNVLDGISSFFSNLFSRNQPLTVAEFLQKVIETDVSYTLLKTSLTEDFSPESSYNVVISSEGSVAANDYKVAVSQIASLVAGVFSNTAVAENKVVEVFTDPSAPAKGVDELFSAIPEDGRRAAYAEALAKEKAEADAEKARESAEAAKKLEEEVKRLSEQGAKASSLADEAQEKAEAAGAPVESLLSKAKDISSGFSWDKFSSQITTAVQKSADQIPKVQVATVRGQAKARTLQPKKAVIRQPAPTKPRATKKPKEELPKANSKPSESKAEVRKAFGGLFRQETVYVDDD